MDSQIQELKPTWKKTHRNKTTHRHIIGKLQNIKYKEVWKITIGKKMIYSGATIHLKADFSTAKLDDKGNKISYQSIDN